MNEHRLASIRHGVISLFPIWPGVVSIGLVYAVVSHTAEFSTWQIVLLSVLVFSGAAQFTISSMVTTHAGVIAIVGTVALLNLRNVLYGMSSARWLPTDRPPKPVLAHCLVDESYGLAEREVVAGRASAWFLLGAGISLFSAWNLSVWTGLLLDRFIDVPTDIGLDFIFPLSFVALTVPLVRSRPQLVAAVVAAAIAIGAGQIFSSGVTIFLATLGAIGTGFLLEPAHGH